MSSRSSPLFAILFASLAAAQAAPLHVVRYGQDLDARDALIRSVSVYADLGQWLVARVDADRASALASRGVELGAFAEPQPGEALVVCSRSKTGMGELHGRLLLSRRAFFVLAVPEGSLPQDCRGSAFHGGRQVIDLSTPYRPTPRVDVVLPAGPDPRVAALVGQVQQTNLQTDVTSLSAIFTRRSTRAENAQAVSLVTTRLGTLAPITFSTQVFNATYGPNIIAELPGVDLANEIVMVGAHLDSIAGTSTTRSPGADDNASGSAAVLEIARIFATQRFRRTIRFAWWNGEEQGLVGSTAYANAAAGRGDRIVAYVNTDMNAYRASGDGYDVDYVLNDSTPSLVSVLAAATTTYVAGLGVNQASLSGGTSDHRAFFRAGFPAAFPFEDVPSYSPFIHTSNDTVGTSANDFLLSRLITQSIVAGLATLAEPLPPAPSFTLDVSSGPTVGGTAVVASGSELASVTAVTVGGRAAAFTLQGNNLAFSTPPSPITGAVDVVLTNPGGNGRQPFTYAVTSPPALRVPASLPRGSSANLVVGGTPGHIEATFLSPALGATNLVVVQLGIGGGNPAALFYVASAALAPSGGIVEQTIAAPNDPSLVGVSFHFQAVTADAGLTAFVPTNVGTVTIQ